MKVLLGVTLNDPETSGTFQVTVKEDGTDLTPVDVTITKDPGTYTPGNISTDGMQLALLENDTVAYAGLRFYTGISITVPESQTLPTEVCNE